MSGNEQNKIEIIYPPQHYRNNNNPDNMLWQRLFGTGIGKTSASDVRG